MIGRLVSHSLMPASAFHGKSSRSSHADVSSAFADRFTKISIYCLWQIHAQSFPGLCSP
jgi:hypothetical protein